MVKFFRIKIICSCCLLLINLNSIGNANDNEGLVEWLKNNNSIEVPHNFIGVLHKVPTDYRFNPRCKLSPSGKYFAYFTLANNASNNLWVYSEIIRGGEEGEKEHYVKKAKWAEKRKYLLNIVNIQESKHIIIDPNDPIYGHLNLVDFRWAGIKDNKVYLKFSPDPFEQYFEYDLSLESLVGSTEGFDYIKSLTPQNILEKYDNGYKPPFEINQYPIITLDGSVYFNLSEYKKSSSRKIKEIEFRQLLGQLGKYYSSIFWNGKKYIIYIERSPISGAYIGAYVINNNSLSDKIPIASPLFGKTDYGENILFVNYGNELLLKRTWRKDVAEKNKIGKTINIKKCYKSTVSLGQKKLIEVLSIKTDRKNTDRKLFVVMADNKYKYWCLLSPDVLVAEKEAIRHIGTSKNTIVPPVSASKNNVITKKSLEREKPSKQSDKLLLTIIGILIGIFISAVIFLAMLFKKKTNRL